MIQDIYPKISHNEYKELVPSDYDFILVFDKNRVLVRYERDHLRYPVKQELSAFSCSVL